MNTQNEQIHQIPRGYLGAVYDWKGMTHAFIYVHIYIIIYICMHVHIYICTDIYMYIYICTYIYIYVHIYMYRYVCICVYVYVCICIFLNIRMYLDTQQLPSRDDRRKSTGSDHQLWRFSYAFPVETSKAFKSFWIPFAPQNSQCFLQKWGSRPPKNDDPHPNFGVLAPTNLLLGDTREVPSRAVRFRQTITEVEVPFVLTF